MRGDNKMEFLKAEEKFLRKVVPLKAILDLFHVPSYVVDEVKALYFQALKRDLTQGVKLERLVGTLLYHVVKRDNLPFTAYEISRKLELDKHSFLRSYFRVKKELGLDSYRFDAGCLVEKYCSELGLGSGAPLKIREKLEIVEKKNCGPRVKLGFAIYEAYKDILNKEEVAETLGISPNSIWYLQDKIGG